jgi:lipid-A-disaccharide synthase
MTQRFLIVAGEASADMYGAEVVRSLRRKFPDAKFYGLGGPRMRNAGVELEGDISKTAVVGPFEMLSSLGHLYGVFRRIAERVESEPPTTAILLDFPDFNLRLARRIKHARIPIVYYISPQVWGWREGRVKQIRELVDKMLVILPFEEQIYRKAGVDVEFVGHPLIDMVRATKSKNEFCEDHGIDPRRSLVVILPGSRRKEVRFILPTLCEAATLILARKPETQFVLPLAPGLDRGFVQEMIRGVSVKIVTNDTYNAIRYARAAIVKSGTATLETALLGTPEVIVYRISRATWALGKFLLKIRLFGLVNIILGEEVVPELFQDRMTPQAVSQTALRLMDDVWMQSRIRTNYEKLRRQLGTGNVADRVADAVETLVNSGPQQMRG